MKFYERAEILNRVLLAVTALVFWSALVYLAVGSWVACVVNLVAAGLGYFISCNVSVNVDQLRFADEASGLSRVALSAQKTERSAG